MVKIRRTVCGFTIIEVMITLVLIGVLAMMVGPYTINWKHLSDIQQAKGQLFQAHGIAKSAALRNSHGLTEDDSVVAIRLDSENKKLIVIECPDHSICSESKIWDVQLPAGISLSFDEGMTNINLDNTGKILGSRNRLGYQLSKGGQSEDGEIY